MASFQSNADVKLYHNNAINLYTSGTGVFIGDGTDFLSIQATGSASYINSLGSLRIRNGAEIMALFTPNDAVSLYYDDSVKLATHSLGIAVTGTVYADGFYLGDNEYITFGAGPDAAIGSDGTTLVIKNGVATETMAVFVPNSYVELRYDNIKSFRTAANGVSIFDTSGSTAAITFYDDASTKMALNYANAANWVVQLGAANENAIVAHLDGAVDLYYNNSQKFVTSATGATVTGTLIADGLAIGSNEYLALGSEGVIYSDATSVVIGNGAADEVLAKFTQDGASELYFNNIKEAETVSGYLKATNGFRIGATAATVTLIDPSIVAPGLDTSIPTEKAVVDYVAANTGTASAEIEIYRELLEGSIFLKCTVDECSDETYGSFGGASTVHADGYLNFAASDVWTSISLDESTWSDNHVRVMLVADYVGSGTFEISADGGSSWESVTPNVVHDVVSTGGTLVATLSPTDKHAEITLSGGDLTATRSAAASQKYGVRCTHGFTQSTPKFYYEVTCNVRTGQNYSIGTCDIGAPLSGYHFGVQSREDTWGWLSNPRNYYKGSYTSLSGGGSVATDVLMVAIDPANKSIWYGKNGTWLTSSDPGAGTGAHRTNLFVVATTLYPGWSAYQATESVTYNFGATSFAHSIPSGFVSYNAAITAGATPDDLRVRITDGGSGDLDVYSYGIFYDPDVAAANLTQTNVKWSVALSSSQDNIAVASVVRVEFDTTTGHATVPTFDTAGAFDTVNNYFVAPVSGYYQCNLSVILNQVDSVTTKIWAGLYNSTDVMSVWTWLPPDQLLAGDDTLSLGLSTVMYVEADDYIEARLFQDDGTSQVDVDSTYSVFSGFLIA
jgi:hypothetical protein